MEPKEEFEFKPITEGLGFHKKNSPKLARKSQMNFSASNESQFSSSSSSDSDLSNTLASSLSFDTPTNAQKPTTTKSNSQKQSDVLKQIKFQANDPMMDLDITPSLPRKKDNNSSVGLLKKEDLKDKTSIPSSPTLPSSKDSYQNEAVDAILKSLKEKNKTDFTTLKQTQTYKPCPMDLSAAGLDSLLVIAAELFCLIIVLMLTKVDLFGVLLSPDADPMIYVAMYALTATVTWIYLTVNRIFLGFTPGEWVFDQRLGLPEQQQNPKNAVTYAWKTAARSFLIVLTGILPIPIISMLMNKDLIGQWLKLELHKKA